MEEKTPEKYRLDNASGTLYEYSADHDAYLFVSNTQKRTLKSAIKEYDEYQKWQEHKQACDEQLYI